MQEYWENYFKYIDGILSLVQFNAGISIELDEIKTIYPTIAFVKTTLKEPNKNGFLTKDEEPEILFLEDKLEAALIKFRIGKYVGRIISNGEVTFLYYLQFTYNWNDFLNYALDEFEDYNITQGFSDDINWNYYHKLLYPNSKEWQIIQNHKACDRLQQSGDSLKISRAIEHKLYFDKTTKQKDKLIEVLQKDGFKIKKNITHPTKDVEGLSFYRKDSVEYENIDKLTFYLIDIIEQHEALYDGWESSVIKS